MFNDLEWHNATILKIVVDGSCPEGHNPIRLQNASRYCATEVGEGSFWLKKSMLKATVFQPMCYQSGLRR